MKHKLILALLCVAGLTQCIQQKKYHDSFSEDFSNSSSEYFEHHSSGNGALFTRAFGIDSPTEPGTKVLSFKLDPEDSAGAGRGPEIISNNFTAEDAHRPMRFPIKEPFTHGYDLVAH